MLITDSRSSFDNPHNNIVSTKIKVVPAVSITKPINVSGVILFIMTPATEEINVTRSMGVIEYVK